jgi:Na+-translocating ferredoxin:NAD+ oxidoreductase RNF subunit RnfB
MGYVIDEPCVGTKHTACVAACPVDCIIPRKTRPKTARFETDPC